jgi:hypothetical protein
MPADCSQASPPTHAVAATVKGDAVTLTSTALRDTGSIGDGDRTTYDTVRLEFEGVDGFELGMTLAVPHRQRLDGRTYRRVAEDQDDQPSFETGTSQVQGWRVHDRAHGVDASFVFHSASLRVEFGNRRGAVLPGRIWFCAPKLAVQVAGAFEAKMPR